MHIPKNLINRKRSSDSCSIASKPSPKRNSKLWAFNLLGGIALPNPHARASGASMNDRNDSRATTRTACVSPTSEPTPPALISRPYSRTIVMSAFVSSPNEPTSPILITRPYSRSRSQTPPSSRPASISSEYSRSSSGSTGDQDDASSPTSSTYSSGDSSRRSSSNVSRTTTPSRFSAMYTASLPPPAYVRAPPPEPVLMLHTSTSVPSSSYSNFRSTVPRPDGKRLSACGSLRAPEQAYAECVTPVVRPRSPAHRRSGSGGSGASGEGEVDWLALREGVRRKRQSLVYGGIIEERGASEIGLAR